MKQKGRLRSQLPKIDDVVIVKDEVPLGTWKLGRIIQMNRGKNGEGRSVKVKLSTGRSLLRSPADLAPLELED